MGKKNLAKLILTSVLSFISYALTLISFGIALCSDSFYKMAFFGLLTLVWLFVAIFNLVIAINVNIKKK